MTKELVMRWCITKRVKRLVGNEIELGIKIPTIEPWASDIPMDKGNYICCHKGLTDKDLHRICSIQYEHLGSGIGYWSEMSLGHVYIVLEPVGSARLMFGDNRYYEFMWYDVPKVVRSPRCDHGHEGVSKWLRHKDWYIGRQYSATRSVSGCTRYISEYRGGYRNPPGD